MLPSYTYSNFAQIGFPDTEAGCVSCNRTKSNEFYINVNEIDWAKTTHRRVPPENRVYAGQYNVK